MGILAGVEAVVGVSRADFTDTREREPVWLEQSPAGLNDEETSRVW